MILRALLTTTATMLRARTRPRPSGLQISSRNMVSHHDWMSTVSGPPHLLPLCILMDLDVYLNYPVSRSLQLKYGNGSVFNPKLQEDVLPQDETSG